MVIVCNCNKKIKPKEYIAKTKIILRNMWENSQLQENPIIVTKINKT
jgi:hypothetical protein